MSDFDDNDFSIPENNSDENSLPKKAGQAMIPIVHPKSVFTKNVILII